MCTEGVIVTPQMLTSILFEKKIISEEEVERLNTAGEILDLLVEKGVVSREDIESHNENAVALLKKIFDIVEKKE